MSNTVNSPEERTEIVALRWEQTDLSASAPATPALYQLYGYHILYGDSVLLYIGRTMDYCRREGQHARSWTKYEQNVSVYLAPLTTECTDQSHIDTLLADVERLLVFTHSPAYNSRLLSWVPTLYAHKNLVVRNYGRKMSLLPEISLSHWVQFYELGGWGGSSG